MKKILLADDSPISRHLIKTMLLESYELIDAEDGEDAYNKAKNDTFDLFLLDLNMPSMDGLTLSKALREDPKYAKTPIIILTSEVREEKKQEAREAGATGWIVKDCEQSKFIEIVKKLIG